MTTISENINLLNHNTFRLNSLAAGWSKITCINDVLHAINYSKKNNIPITPIGDGSNILLRPNVNKLFVDVQLKGIKVIGEDDKKILVEVYAGENWHDWVCYASKKNWYGLENLAFIPGRVGASPIQNIGAYGVEVSDFIESVEYIDLLKSNRNKLCFSRFNNGECNFSYRNSIFKSLKNSLIITSVTFKLNKVFAPNLSYPTLSTFLKKNKKLKSIDVINAVTNIRKEKLPDPKLLPNVGSFFKNIQLNDEEFRYFLEVNSDAPFFKKGDFFKIPSAWLIDKCGYKGKTYKSLGMHNKQALVMVNYFNKNEENYIDLNDVFYFSNKIRDSVKRKFNLDLDIEPEIIS